jgi:hypothetical protein
MAPAARIEHGACDMVRELDGAAPPLRHAHWACRGMAMTAAPPTRRATGRAAARVACGWSPPAHRARSGPGRSPRRPASRPGPRTGAGRAPAGWSRRSPPDRRDRGRPTGVLDCIDARDLGIPLHRAHLPGRSAEDRVASRHLTPGAGHQASDFPHAPAARPTREVAVLSAIAFCVASASASSHRPCPSSPASSTSASCRPVR